MEFNFILQNKLILMLGICIIFDILTGIIKAVKTKKLKSSYFRNGGFKKFLIILVVILSYLLDNLFFENNVLYAGTISYFILNETISIIENVGKCGVKLPKKIKETLQNLNNE